MAISDEMRRRIEAFALELCEDLDEVDDSNALSWLDAIEDRAVQIGDAVATSILERNATDSPLPEDEAACPQCGKPGRYRGMRQREMLGRRGPAAIAEPEYHCPCCRKAFFPDDRGDWR